MNAGKSAIIMVLWLKSPCLLGPERSVLTRVAE